jgi:hypothetical protein
MLAFLEQLLKIGSTVRDDPIVGRRNFFELLKKSPKQIIAQLVFESRNYKKAETLAQGLELDLVRVILDSVGFGPSAMSSATPTPTKLNPTGSFRLIVIVPRLPFSHFIFSHRIAQRPRAIGSAEQLQTQLIWSERLRGSGVQNFVCSQQRQVHLDD